MKGRTVQPHEQTHEHVHPKMHTHPRALPSCGASSRPPSLPPISPPLRRSCPSAWELLCPIPSSRPHPALWGSSYHGPPRPAHCPPPGLRPIRIAVRQHPIPRTVAQHGCKQKVKETASGLSLQSLCFSFPGKAHVCDHSFQGGGGLLGSLPVFPQPFHKSWSPSAGSGRLEGSAFPPRYPWTEWLFLTL